MLSLGLAEAKFSTSAVVSFLQTIFKKSKDWHLFQIYRGTLTTKTIKVLRIVEALSRSEKLFRSGSTGVFEVSLTMGFHSLYLSTHVAGFEAADFKVLSERSRKPLSQFSFHIHCYVGLTLFINARNVAI